jgi:hypothetical protein
MYNGKHQHHLFFFFYFTGKRGKKDMDCFGKNERPIAFGEEKFHNHDVPSKYTRKFLPMHNNLARFS